MASTFNLSDYLANLIAELLTGASEYAGASLSIYGGVQPDSANDALSGQPALVVFTIPSGEFSIALSDGQALITFPSITTMQALATGTATFFRITNGPNVLCDGSVDTANADCILATVDLVAGADVAISSMTLTVVE